MSESITEYYGSGVELGRLESGSSLIEFERTKELLERYLAPAPARILDVGGGPGVYADWLVRSGYEVKLVDLTPLHVERATELAQGRFVAVEGDARQLDEENASYDVVLLLGPLYHLVERDDRVRSLREAARVVRPGGLVAAAAISRFASLLDCLIVGNLRQPTVWENVEQELADGRHSPRRDEPLFTTAYFHRVEELEAEIAEAGLSVEATFGVEGPGWLLRDRFDDANVREDVLRVARTVEREAALIAASGHLVAIARKP